MARGKHPDPPKKAAKVIADALSDIGSPKPRRRARPPKDPDVPKPPRGMPKRDPNGPVPGKYRQVERYGDSAEGRIAQQARLNDRNKDNLYGGATFKDSKGNSYEVSGKADQTKHAEGDMLKKMRQDIAARQGIDPAQVDLKSELRDVKMFVEFSPCPTGNRCQDMLDTYLPDDAEISYAWPWQPRSEQDGSRDELKTAVNSLFERGSVGPI